MKHFDWIDDLMKDLGKHDLLEIDLKITSDKVMIVQREGPNGRPIAGHGPNAQEAYKMLIDG